MSRYDALIIGAGHNGLVAAAVLARAGLRTLVVEAAAHVGGCSITSELAPGYRCPTLAHRGALAPEIIALLELESQGLSPVRSEVRTCALSGTGRSLAIWVDHNRTANEIGAFSTADAARYPAFIESVGSIAGVLRDLLSAPTPDMEETSARDLISLLRTARRFRALGSTDAYRLLRWLPMPIADFASEWFESAPLGALIAADGVLGAFLGPRSAGSTAQFLLRATTDAIPIAPGWTARGGPGALTAALAAAAQKAGAAIRTHARVQRILVNGHGAEGVTLDDGEQILAEIVVSSLDPRATLLGLIEPAHLPPTFERRARHIRMRGTLAKVNYAVSSAPDFLDLRSRPHDERRAVLAGCLRLAPHMDAIERAFDSAKYGRTSQDPFIELTVPSVHDDSLAPQGQHVLSAYVQFTPYTLRGRTWDDERERLGDLATTAIERYAPGFASSVIARQVITPLDLERNHGLTGGQIFQGEIALDQLFVTRPLLGWSRYRTPVSHLFLCGAGVHPGIGIDGRSGLFAAREILRARAR
ncbi:MAG: phytoene desaturase family protein [Vicinamibacterales bacterium]